MERSELTHNHLRIENLNAHFVEADGGGLPLTLALRGLRATLSREGLSELVAKLIPEEPLRVQIVDQPESTGCLLRIQATRLGFTPRITVALKPATSVAGGILINIDPDNRWSPLDRVMLSIAIHNLDKISRKQPGISRLVSGRYQVDLQAVIRDQLLDSSAPVRWDSRLERIDGNSREIRVEFVSLVEGGGATARKPTP